MGRRIALRRTAVSTAAMGLCNVVVVSSRSAVRRDAAGKMLVLSGSALALVVSVLMLVAPLGSGPDYADIPGPGERVPIVDEVGLGLWLPMALFMIGLPLGIYFTRDRRVVVASLAIAMAVVTAMFVVTVGLFYVLPTALTLAGGALLCLEGTADEYRLATRDTERDHQRPRHKATWDARQ